MNGKKWAVLGSVFLMVGVAAFYLHGWGLHQTLSQPGIRATPIAGSVLMDIQLPPNMPGFVSDILPQAEIVTNMLPKDTSLLTRRYVASDGFFIDLNVVMMGMDRTSIHRPEYCLTGQGWDILKREDMTLKMAGPPEFEIPAMKWTLSKQVKDVNGNIRELRGFYVFWFSAENKLTGSHWQRLFGMWRDLLTTGKLDRWSYISYFTYFWPAGEADASGRIQQFVMDSAAQFQLPPKSNDRTMAAK